MGCKPKKSVCKNKERNYVKKPKSSTSRLRNNSLFFVHLRQPRSSDDPRTDPKYDKGSFGSTGCHNSNLLCPKRILERIGKGDRFVFLQGGKNEKKGCSTIKISFITPPIKEIKISKGCGVIKWDSNWDEHHHKRPLKYEYQFDLLEKPENEEFTKNEKEVLEIINPNILTASRTTKAAMISSCTRTRCKGLVLNSDEAKRILTLYNNHVEEMKRVYGDDIFVRKNSEAYQK